MKKILITGATGFVGKHLVEVINNSNINFAAAVRKKISNNNENYIEVGDIDGATDYGKALKDVNTVIHLAARAHVMNDDSHDPLNEYRKVNVDGTVNLAKQAVAAGVKRFIFISTIKVNGESTTNNIPYLEDDKANPEDHYGVSKNEAEQQLKQISSETGLELVIIRPPLVYGKGAVGNFAKLLKLSSTGLPLPFGSINNKRSMIYVKNLVDFILYCAKHPNAANQTFLISDNDDVSLKRVIATIRDSLGKPKRLVPVPPSLFRLAAKVTGKNAVVDRLIGDLQIDCSKSVSLLDWQPPYTFNQGIKDTLR